MKRSLKKSKLNKFFLWPIMVGFVVATILSVIGTATNGVILAKLERDGLKLKEDNLRLSEEAVSTSSLKNLEKTSESLGFIKPSSIFYVTQKDFVANLP